MTAIKSYSYIYKADTESVPSLCFGLPMVALHCIVNTITSDITFDQFDDRMEGVVETFEKKKNK